MRIRPTAGTVIAKLELEPHPEGGHYRETWRAAEVDGRRSTGTAILYLLRSGEASAWHRVDATEIWHFHTGDPLEITIARDGAEPESHVLGPELVEGEEPQVVVPSGAWQSARTLGAWTLVSCTVSPGFRTEGFELAPPDWEPGAGAGTSGPGTSGPGTSGSSGSGTSGSSTSGSSTSVTRRWARH